MACFKRMVLVLAIVAAPMVPASHGHAESRNFRTEKVSFENDGIVLAATVYVPAGTGPFPGIVVLRGSGTACRSNWWSRQVAEMLARRGLAVLSPDKRGSCDSGGDWREASFEDLADDALAGAAVLRNRAEVDAGNVGLIGLSQGGRIAPLAATRGEAAFVINFVGGAVPAKRGLFHELEQTYRQHGLSDEDVAFLQEMTRLSFVYLETGEGFEDYLAYRRKVRERYGEKAVESWPDSRDHWYWRFWREIHDYDPVPHWKELTEARKIPVFIAYGEEDEQDNMPVAESVRRLRKNISSDLLTVRIYPEVGHSLMVHGDGGMAFTAALLDDLDGWLDRYVLRPAGAK